MYVELLELGVANQNDCSSLSQLSLSSLTQKVRFSFPLLSLTHLTQKITLSLECTSPNTQQGPRDLMRTHHYPETYAVRTGYKTLLLESGILITGPPPPRPLTTILEFMSQQQTSG